MESGFLSIILFLPLDSGQDWGAHRIPVTFCIFICKIHRADGLGGLVQCFLPRHR